MNYIQLLLYIMFAFGALTFGIGAYSFLNPPNTNYINRRVFIGESLLIGSISLVGVFMILSMINCYRAPFLLAAVLLSYCPLLNKDVRKIFHQRVISRINWNVVKVAWLMLLIFFVFRNCYFAFDADSITNYLHSQRVWLERGSSLSVTQADNLALFFPQFDIIPSALGLSIFPQETLFPQLINIHWRLIAMLLVFGYTSYRLNDLFGLAATMLVLFNDHIYYSGANNSVLINAAVISLIFAASYNFWETFNNKSPFRFLLALGFIIHIVPNKYQLLYCMLFILVFCSFIQRDIIGILKSIFSNKKWLIFASLCVISASLFLLRNFIVTGDPLFPGLAGRLNVFGWTLEKEQAIIRFAGGLSITKFIKYATFFFVWPGVQSTKYIIMILFALPAMFVGLAVFDRFDKKEFVELCFWILLSIFMVAGTCMASFIDPRYFRYSIALTSYTAVFAFYFIFLHCLNIKSKLIGGILAIILALPGYKIMFAEEGSLMRPSIKENLAVIANKIHTDYVVTKSFPQVQRILEAIDANPGKFNKAAYFTAPGNYPLFFLPTKPIVAVFRTSLICWDSFESQDLIIKDLANNDIDWIIYPSKGKVVFLSREEFATEAVRFDTNPQKIMSDYGIPEELRVR